MTRVLAVLALVFARVAADPPIPPQFPVTWVASSGTGVPEDHAAAIRLLLARASLRLPRPVIVSYEHCGEENAYYYAERRTVAICHELWAQRRVKYLRTGHPHELLEDRLRDAMAFTVFHELAHALHRELDLPLLGRIEDGVDQLATLWLIRIGAYDVAKRAAEGHFLRTGAHDFRDEHGSGPQRGFAIACSLHGANAAGIADLMRRMEVPAEKLARCARDYTVRVRAWETLLAPYLR